MTDQSDGSTRFLKRVSRQAADERQLWGQRNSAFVQARILCTEMKNGVGFHPYLLSSRRGAALTVAKRRENPALRFPRRCDVAVAIKTS